MNLRSLDLIVIAQVARSCRIGQEAVVLLHAPSTTFIWISIKTQKIANKNTNQNEKAANRRHHNPRMKNKLCQLNEPKNCKI